LLLAIVAVPATARASTIACGVFKARAADGLGTQWTIARGADRSTESACQLTAALRMLDRGAA
jgi:hypothetical protein